MILSQIYYEFRDLKSKSKAFIIGQAQEEANKSNVPITLYVTEMTLKMYDEDDREERKQLNKEWFISDRIPVRKDMML